MSVAGKKAQKVHPRHQLGQRDKLPGETHRQWCARIAQIDHVEATRGENLLTPEQERSGQYEDQRVTGDDGGTVRTKVNKRQSSIARMHAKGSITAEQYQAALDIARVAEMIGGDVGFRGASIEERVSGSGRADLATDRNLRIIRLERLYTEWRERLPMPRRLYIDLVLSDQGAAELARSYRHDWPTARKRLIRSLDVWVGLKDRIWNTIDDAAVAAAEQRINAC